MNWTLIFGAVLLAWSSLSIMGTERDRLEREAQQRPARSASDAGAASASK
jgi:hypothetical protein